MVKGSIRGWRGGHCSGWYASYLNAFLFMEWFYSCFTDYLSLDGQTVHFRKSTNNVLGKGKAVDFMSPRTSSDRTVSLMRRFQLEQF